MQIPARISFHNMDSSDALVARIRQKIAKLEQRVKHLVNLQVMVESSHRHQNKGRLYSVRIDATLPGGQLVVSHHPGKNPRKHDKVFAAMNNAFAAIEKQLTRYQQTQWTQSFKTHDKHWQEAVVSNLISDDGFGFLATIQGDEVYFHHNAVESDRFFDLDVGVKVKFVLASDGVKGPQASVVRLPSRRRLIAA